MICSIEFEVDSVELDPSGQIAIVDGKLIKGPVRIKDKLNSIYEVDWIEPDADGVRIPRAINIGHLDLAISSIFSFHRDLEELSQGYTATIQVIGNPDDLEKIRPGTHIARLQR
jgi:hypothetical protein